MLVSSLVFSNVAFAEKDQSSDWPKQIISFWMAGKISDKEYTDAIKYLNYHTNLQKTKEASNISTDDIYDKNTIKTTRFVYVEPLQEWAENAKDSLSTATIFWEKTSNVKFITTTHKSDSTIQIRWIKEANKFQAAYTIGGKIIEIGTGYSCNGKWNSYDSKTISLLLIHELGHTLGMEHAANQNDIMYPVISTTSNISCNI